MFSSIKQLGARLRAELAQTFRSLRQPNYRTYSIGQLISLTGSWMQSVALQWIAYDMTHSAWLLGVVAVFTNVPVLLLSLLGGAAADRYDRRRILIATQWVELIVAVVLTALVATGSLQIWMILGLSSIMGIATAFEMPSRQALVPELSNQDDLVNAISLNSVILNSTRMVGPAIGAVLLASWGGAICFGINAFSFLAAIITLHMLRLTPKAPVEKKPGATTSMLDGLRAVISTPAIRNLFILTFFTSFFGFQFTVLLPMYVRDVFHRSAESLGLLTAATGVGSLAASLFFASRAKPELLKRTIKIAAVGVAVTLLAFAASPYLPLTLVILVFTGIAFSMQFNSSNSLLQLGIDDAVRGRVMSVYSMILLGAAPFGSLLIGMLADAYGAPLAVAVCGIACSFSALFFITRK